MRFMLLMLMVLSGTANAQYLELDKFSLKIMRFTCNREILTPEIQCEQYKGRIAAEFDLSLFDVGFWRNDVHGEGTDSKFMTMGWRYEMGIKLGQFEFFHEHHSRHVLDQKEPRYWDEGLQDLRDTRYPVEDSYGVRIIFYERKK